MSPDEVCDAVEDAFAHAMRATRSLLQSEAKGVSDDELVVLSSYAVTSWETFDRSRSELHARLVIRRASAPGT
ncbi:MAG TPA: hypothetical protein VFG69_13470 [Nannocystaceae bacterium]|nr:hypothetical protein [Nannocystaceae bacterium]